MNSHSIDEGPSRQARAAIAARRVALCLLAAAASAWAEAFGPFDYGLDPKTIVSQYVGRFTEPPRQVPSFHCVS